MNSWFAGLIESADFQVETIPLSASREWSLFDGAIRHRTGGFFNVVGITWHSPSGEPIAQPLLEQREIGMLGFLIRPGEFGKELLVQAKIEPGNVGIVQLAPTCQATYSNASRIHGGEYPPFSELFNRGGLAIIRRSLNSEQGTRFLAKRNDNVLAVPRYPIAESLTHRWIAVDEVLELLSSDFLINTDARSVLVCSPWEELVDREPFTRKSDYFSAGLAASTRLDREAVSTERLKDELQQIRARTARPTIVRLEDLPGWTLDEFGIVAENGASFRVYQIKVRALGREVPEWDQPIIDTSADGLVDLVCGWIDGVPHFLFRVQIEPGLFHIAELGPTVAIGPGQAAAVEIPDYGDEAKVMVDTWLSDEGGRFYQDQCLYRIIDVGSAYTPPERSYWLSLRQIRDLLEEGGWFTNEARSVLAMLLGWL